MNNGNALLARRSFDARSVQTRSKTLWYTNIAELAERPLLVRLRVKSG